MIGLGADQEKDVVALEIDRSPQLGSRPCEAFVHPVHEGMLKSFDVKLDQRGNVAANVNDYKTSIDKLFAAGDMRRGQSLVVWAIREGRQCARSIDQYLMGQTTLPR